MNRKLKISLIAFSGADKQTYQNGEQQLYTLINPEFVEITTNKPDVIFVLSGGSELLATQIVDNKNFILILSNHENNSNAAATEIKAWMNSKKIPSILIDINCVEAKNILNDFYHIKNGLENLTNKRIGLLGNVSNWLIISDISNKQLHDIFGMQLIQRNWDQLKSYLEFPNNHDFDAEYKHKKGKFDLYDSSKVYTLLKNFIELEKLDAITVECFPLVRKHSVTACLALAKLNNDQFPAGCEGDIVSITGKLLIQAITGIIPWMANTVHVSEHRTLFAHCTIAPNLVDDYVITTHFETGVGTAIQGTFAANECTIFRLDNELKKAYISFGEIINYPKYDNACRTQIEVKLPNNAIHILRNNPLGNHHLIIPGDFRERLKLALKVLNIQEI